MSNKHANIISVGIAVPDRIITNNDLEKTLDTSDEWILTRTGIRRRHVYAPGSDEPAYVLGSRAAGIALERAGKGIKDIDGIICATFTPDYFFPSTACCIARSLGAGDIPAFDISAACAGFIYGLTMANALIVSGQCKRILLVGAEIISKTLDWKDRSTAILFGDAAGAVVLEETSDGKRGILSTSVGSDGTLGDILMLPAWGNNRIMNMKGSEVFKIAVRMMGASVIKALEKCGLGFDKVDLLVPHQANIRIITSLAQHLGMSMDKVVTNLEEYGNTSSASIPLALDSAWNNGRIKNGTVAVLTALGGGVAYGSAVVRF